MGGIGGNTPLTGAAGIDNNAVGPGQYAAAPMAAGGIVTRPTYALVGEAGPEAVIPLAEYNARGGGGGTYHIYIHSDGPMSDDSCKRLAENLSNYVLKRDGRLVSSTAQLAYSVEASNS